MKKIIFALIAVSALLSTSANAVKLGFGFDQDFGVVAQFDDINAFVGNDGATADFILKRGSLRLYGPKKEALEGIWDKPPLIKQ